MKRISLGIAAGIFLLAAGVLVVSCTTKLEAQISEDIEAQTLQNTQFPGIFSLRDSVDILEQFGRPEIRSEYNDTVTYEYVDYYVVKFIGGDIIYLAEIGWEGKDGVQITKVVFNSDVLFVAHQKRFQTFMNYLKIEYTDGGCEFGWNMTALPYRADYTMREAAPFFPNGIPQGIYNKYFAENNN